MLKNKTPFSFTELSQTEKSYKETETIENIKKKLIKYYEKNYDENSENYENMNLMNMIDDILNRLKKKKKKKKI